MRDGESLISRGLDSARLLRGRLAAEVAELRVIATDELMRRPGVTGVDPTHVLIEVAPIGLTGYQATDWLRHERDIDIELVDHRRIMPLVSFAHGAGEIDRLVRALRDLVDAHPEQRDAAPRRFPSRRELRTESVMLPRDAFLARTQNVTFKDAAGRVSAELITPYPPGIPAVAPGELYNEANLAYLEEFVALGGYVEGATDPTLDRLRVVAE